MKIAVCGSAGSLAQAPFKNAAYQAWAQGKMESAAREHASIPGEFDIWMCSPAGWAQSPRITRFFEVHRWEPGKPWLSPEYCQFLRDFKGPVYTGGTIPELPNHVVYPIDRIEAKFSAFFLTSSLALMMAMAIDEIEQVRRAREDRRFEKIAAREQEERARLGYPEAEQGATVLHALPQFVDPSELDKDDSDDVIGMWGVDMSAGEEYGYQRPGCQFFVLEAMRRGIGVYLPPESEVMRPMPVYGLSEWDHNYIKLTSRARELNNKATAAQGAIQEATTQMHGAQGEMHALEYFVSTWTNPYGFMTGMVIRQDGEGLGSGITQIDARPISRMQLGEPTKAVLDAMSAPTPYSVMADALLDTLKKYCGPDGYGADPAKTLDIALSQRNEYAALINAGQDKLDELRTEIARLKKKKLPTRKR